MPEPPFDILLIDDDEDDLEMLSASLALQGITTKCFNASQKAILYLQHIPDTTVPPALIILDYNMPKINGQQILLLIKDGEKTRDIPVVMYSTNMSDVHKKALMDLGALHCFAKPSTYEDFNNQVEVFKSLASSTIRMKI